MLDMPKLSAQHFAEKAGVTRQTIYNQIKAGALFLGDDKKLDLDIPENLQYLRDRGVSLDDMKPPEKKPSTPRPKKSRSKPPAKPKSKAPAAPPAELPGVDAEEVLARLSSLDIRNLTPADVGKVARLESALKTRVEREHKRGLLIDRAAVQTVFGRLYMIDSNELRTLGSKLAPEISGMLGAEDPEKVLAVEKRIDDEVLKSLAHIKRVLGDFLRKAGADCDL